MNSCHLFLDFLRGKLVLKKIKKTLFKCLTSFSNHDKLLLVAFETFPDSSVGRALDC